MSQQQKQGGQGLNKAKGRRSAKNRALRNEMRTKRRMWHTADRKRGRLTRHLRGHPEDGSAKKALKRLESM